jgi:hypothetical protein
MRYAMQSAPPVRDARPLSSASRSTALAKSVADLRGDKFSHQEIHDRHERWIQKIARKIRLRLEA